MQNTFVINGKTYTAAPFNFNTVCDLEELGMSLSTVAKNPMSAVRAYFAVCLGGDRERAGNEIEQHVINGGDMSVIIEAMNKEMEASDFFRALQTDKDEESQTGEAETAEESPKKARKTSRA